eukprot:CAMPEP_0197445840 /NCGR_PEP_ID=MMETSP1175-20131217/10957_1 /TAXON_ID=1003142 /ORGANISM="Triceratium dubium, Strain CCMP147" /LENGTH=74 /DNA_ID=CAMNT_0042976867 /DNA_START=339 /DNA_END=563 /DNA_ORIENTATION=-
MKQFDACHQRYKELLSKLAESMKRSSTSHQRYNELLSQLAESMKQSEQSRADVIRHRKSIGTGTATAAAVTAPA